MIFRRIKAHIEKENWFAVGIDFCIVVIGVFIGIQVSNWNSGMQNASKRSAAIEALQTEYENNIDILRRSFENQTARNETEQAMAVAISTYALRGPNEAGPTLSSEEQDIIEAGFTQIMYFAPIGVRESTYESLKQSGDLALIQDQEVLFALNEFSRRLAWIAAQRSSFRNGMSDLNTEWRDYVFHTSTKTPTITNVDIDYESLLEDRRALSAAVQVTRMKAIFSSYLPRLIEDATATCETLARHSGRPCRSVESAS